MEQKEILHLDRAAKLLHCTSPAVSRSLAISCVERKYQTGIVARHNACPTCGTIQVPGHTSSSRGGRTLCLICHRSQKSLQTKKPTRKAMMARQEEQRRLSAVAKIDSSSESITEPAQAMETPASPKPLKSKDRKKSKNKGLASLLAKQKASAAIPNKTSALDLSDFMM